MHFYAIPAPLQPATVTKCHATPRLRFFRKYYPLAFLELSVFYSPWPADHIRHPLLGQAMTTAKRQTMASPRHREAVTIRRPRRSRLTECLSKIRLYCPSPFSGKVCLKGITL